MTTLVLQIRESIVANIHVFFLRPSRPFWHRSIAMANAVTQLLMLLFARPFVFCGYRTYKSPHYYSTLVQNVRHYSRKRGYAHASGALCKQPPKKCKYVNPSLNCLSPNPYQIGRFFQFAKMNRASTALWVFLEGLKPIWFDPRRNFRAGCNISSGLSCPTLVGWRFINLSFTYSRKVETVPCIWIHPECSSLFPSRFTTKWRHADPAAPNAFYGLWIYFIRNICWWNGKNSNGIIIYKLSSGWWFS